MRFISRTIFIFIKHPLAIGLILLLQTTLICLLTGLIIKTFWFSYVLFLVFLGGILVLFIYVTSLASNEMFSLSIKIFCLRLISFIFISLLIWTKDKNIIFSFFINYDIYMINEISAFYTENSLILNKIYNFPINLVSILLMIYLFLTLIAVVKITNIFEGPLRPKSF